MDDLEGWIEPRLLAAVEASTTAGHVCPEAVVVEFRRLLGRDLQATRKPSELETIAASLAAANRGDS